MEPCASGPVTILPGWNDVFRAQPLRDLGINLAQELRLGTFLIHRLKSTGCRLYLEDRARMRHFDPPNWRFEVLIAAIVGSGFGALRTQHWPIVARIAYPLGAPLIALLHWKRGWVQYNRVRPAPPVRPMALVAAFGLAIAWALGESAGAWLGPRRVTPHLWRAETKPPRFEDVARSNAEEREFV
jgi:hypothetical protein